METVGNAPLDAPGKATGAEVSVKTPGDAAGEAEWEETSGKLPGSQSEYIGRINCV